MAISGSVLTVTPVSSGSATVSVTATDAGGSSGTATQTFVVTVSNEAPVAVGTLPDRTLRVSDGSVTVEVSGAFSDADGDALSYTASSSAPGVATVAISGSVLTATPVSSGSATVSVTATDAGGSSGTATQSFVVTVPNAAPVAVGTLPDRTLRVSDGPATVEVSGAFSDADGDRLTYTAVSSAPAVATASVSGSVLTVTPVSSGAATVTVTAADATAGTATQSFAVTVPDAVPVAVGTLSDRTLRVSDGAVTVEVSGAFSDADGDALTYTASSSAPGVATVSVSGSALTLTPVSSGSATVSVTATDAGGSGGTATQSFTVTVEAETADTGDYDTDDDGLIEITTLAQLDVVRHDLDGDGTPPSSGSTAYGAAFPDAVSGLGCPASDCIGYELAADLDFDTNENGVADAGDAYWNGGSGWAPIGTRGATFAARFEGNGHTVSGLFISREDRYLGLFGGTSTSTVIRHVGLVAVEVSGESRVGGLVGFHRGVIRGSWVTGAVSADEYGGGLVGANRQGEVAGSYSTASVTVGRHSGGLVGFTYEGEIRASYATGRVSGTSNVGGLLGTNRGGAVSASYATGRVTGTSGVGGLVGGPENGTVTAGYWDTATSGQATGETGAGSGAATSALQGPTGYSGLYAAVGRGHRRRRDVGRFVVVRDGERVSGAVGGRGRRRDADVGGVRPAVAVGTGGDGGVGDGRGVADVDGGGGGRVDAVSCGDVCGVSDVWRDGGAGWRRVWRRRRTTDTSAGGSESYQVAAEVWGGESTRSGAVTPGTVNRPPVAEGSLSGVSLGVSSGAVTVEVSGAFSDPDSDALTYAAVSSAPGVATVSVSGSVLTVVRCRWARRR